MLKYFFPSQKAKGAAHQIQKEDAGQDHAKPTTDAAKQLVALGLTPSKAEEVVSAINAERMEAAQGAADFVKLATSIMNPFDDAAEGLMIPGAQVARVYQSSVTQTLIAPAGAKRAIISCDPIGCTSVGKQRATVFFLDDTQTTLPRPLTNSGIVGDPITLSTNLDMRKMDAGTILSTGLSVNTRDAELYKYGTNSAISQKNRSLHPIEFSSATMSTQSDDDEERLLGLDKDHGIVVVSHNPGALKSPFIQGVDNEGGAYQNPASFTGTSLDVANQAARVANVDAQSILFPNNTLEPTITELNTGPQVLYDSNDFPQLSSRFNASSMPLMPRDCYTFKFTSGSLYLGSKKSVSKRSALGYVNGADNSTQTLSVSGEGGVPEGSPVYYQDVATHDFTVDIFGRSFDVPCAHVQINASLGATCSATSADGVTIYDVSPVGELDLSGVVLQAGCGVAGETMPCIPITGVQITIRSKVGAPLTPVNTIIITGVTKTGADPMSAFTPTFRSDVSKTTAPVFGQAIGGFSLNCWFPGYGVDSATVTGGTVQSVSGADSTIIPVQLSNMCGDFIKMDTRSFGTRSIIVIDGLNSGDNTSPSAITVSFAAVVSARLKAINAPIRGSKNESIKQAPAYECALEGILKNAPKVFAGPNAHEASMIVFEGLGGHKEALALAASEGCGFFSIMRSMRDVGKHAGKSVKAVLSALPPGVRSMLTAQMRPVLRKAVRTIKQSSGLGPLGYVPDDVIVDHVCKMMGIRCSTDAVPLASSHEAVGAGLFGDLGRVADHIVPIGASEQVGAGLFGDLGKVADHVIPIGASERVGAGLFGDLGKVADHIIPIGADDSTPYALSENVATFPTVNDKGEGHAVYRIVASTRPRVGRNYNRHVRDGIAVCVDSRLRSSADASPFYAVIAKMAKERGDDAVYFTLKTKQEKRMYGRSWEASALAAYKGVDVGTITGKISGLGVDREGDEYAKMGEVRGVEEKSTLVNSLVAPKGNTVDAANVLNVDGIKI